jgi:hypothetical protein
VVKHEAVRTEGDQSVADRIEADRIEGDSNVEEGEEIEVDSYRPARRRKMISMHSLTRSRNISAL